MFAYNAAMSRKVASSSSFVLTAYFDNSCCMLGSFQCFSRIAASRPTPSNVNGKPVESRGSTKPAADGKSAHRSPTTVELRNDSCGRYVKGRTDFASANCAASDG